MKLKKLLILVVVTVCIIIYSYSAIRTNAGPAFSISINMAKPLSIIWPCEIAVVGNSGEKGLRIGPKIGRGWCDEAGGQATYKFYVPQDCKYYIWAYALWFDVCTNAVFAKIDDLDKAVLGNDPIYNKWHWVRGFDVNLKKGTHSLVLSNHSDHIALQKVLFTNSASITPDDCGLVFSDIFYDGFDGCDQGNFASWNVIAGDWQVYHPADEICITENILSGCSTNNAMVIVEDKSWSDYSLVFSVLSPDFNDQDVSVGVCFGVKSVAQYYQLKWRFLESENCAKMQVVRKDGEHTDVLTRFETTWDLKAWHQIEITLSARKILIMIDSERDITVPVDEKLIGGIGFSLEGETTAYFDDIHIREAGRI